MEYHELTETEKQVICGWHYGGKWSVYDLPDYETMRREKQGICDSEMQRQFLAWYQKNRLVAFTRLLEEKNEVFVAVGVRPDLRGQGLGSQILRQVQSLARTRYPGKRLYMWVRTWNLQAVNCYKRAGFSVDGVPVTRKTVVGEGRFLRMVWR